MDYFQLLPEDCVSNILSFTSPKDVGISSAVSRRFNSSAASNNIWEKFLPHDYKDIVSRYVSPRIYPSKKELYLSLCDSPVLMDGGKLSFSLDKKTGKKCFMISAREVASRWQYDPPCYWEWMPHPDSRFSEVAHLTYLGWLDIEGTIGTQMLSKRTTYVVYLVFKWLERHNGLEIGHALVGLGLCEGIIPRTKIRKGNVKYPRERVDGWMEIELGNFLNDTGDDEVFEAQIMKIAGTDEKGELIVQGIEYRPE